MFAPPEEADSSSGGGQGAVLARAGLTLKPHRVSNQSRNLAAIDVATLACLPPTTSSVAGSPGCPDGEAQGGAVPPARSEERTAHVQDHCSYDAMSATHSPSTSQSIVGASCSGKQTEEPSDSLTRLLIAARRTRSPFSESSITHRGGRSRESSISTRSTRAEPAAGAAGADGSPACATAIGRIGECEALAFALNVTRALPPAATFCDADEAEVIQTCARAAAHIAYSTSGPERARAPRSGELSEAWHRELNVPHRPAGTLYVGHTEQELGVLREEQTMRAARGDTGPRQLGAGGWGGPGFGAAPAPGRGRRGAAAARAQTSPPRARRATSRNAKPKADT